MSVMKEGIEHIYSNVLLLSTAIKNYLNKKKPEVFCPFTTSESSVPFKIRLSQTFIYIFRWYHLFGENYLLAICIISCCLISFLHKTPALMPHCFILPEARLCLLVQLGTSAAHSSLIKGLIQVALITCKSATCLPEALCQTSVLIKMLTISASPSGNT